MELTHGAVACKCDPNVASPSTYLKVVTGLSNEPEHVVLAVTHIQGPAECVRRYGRNKDSSSDKHPKLR